MTLNAIPSTITTTGALAKIMKITFTVMPDERTTICQLTMQNGYTVNGYSACVTRAMFDKTVGEKAAYDDAVRNLWPLEGYLLAERRYQEACDPLGDRTNPYPGTHMPPGRVDEAAAFREHMRAKQQAVAEADAREAIPRPEKERPPEKTLHNSDISGARVNVPDIRVVGDGDLFQLLCKASSQREGWMKSSKAMQVADGCVVQVTTQQRNPDGSYSVAEALTYVPGVQISYLDPSGGRRLQPMRKTG